MPCARSRAWLRRSWRPFSSTAGSLGASPSVAPPSDAENLQAWANSGIAAPPDAPAGVKFETGVSFWDTARHDFAAVEGVRVRLLPGKGSAKPSEATVEPDRTGHVVIHVAVPKGGPGKLEISIAAGGRSVRVPVAGTGPPPEARPDQILTATFRPFVGDLVAGRPFPVAVELGGWGDWGADTLMLPDHVVVIAATASDPEAATAELVPSGSVDPAFKGHLTIPDTGPATIGAAVQTAGGGTAPIPGSIDITVIVGGRRDSPAPSTVAAAPAPAPAGPATTGGDGIPPIVWIVAIGAVLVVLVGLGLRRLGDV